MFSAPTGALGATTTYDLAATTSGTVQAPAGGSGTLAVSWRNKGPGTAPRAALAVTPPIGTTFGVLPAGWQRSGNSAVRSVTALASGGSGAASFAVVVNKNAVPGGLLVGGFFEVSGAGGVDRAPANNEAAFRIRVRDGKVTPSPTPSVKATPSPTPTVKATPTAKPTVKPKPAVTQPPKARSTSTSRGAAARSSTGPSPKVSTHLAVAPSASGSADDDAASGVIELIDGPGGSGSSALVPMVGALTCFTAAGLGVVILRRRRLDARADAAELRSMRGR